VHEFSMMLPYTQTYVNSNNSEKKKKRNIVSISYEITLLLLSTLRFPELRTSETTEEQRHV
jgi:hypothetical protein